MCVLDLSTGTVWCVGVFCIVTNVQNIVGLLGFVTFITITMSGKTKSETSFCKSLYTVG